MRDVHAPDGVRLAADVFGDGDPLLLLPGQGASHAMWGPLLRTFAERHRVVVFDYRGTGGSDAPPGPYSTRGFAADAVAVLDAFGIAVAHVYGFSMGGRVAQWVAIDHPERVGALVLGATSPGDAHGAPRPAEAEARFRRGGDLNEFLYGPEFARARTAGDWRSGTSPRARGAHYRASEEHDSWARLGEITAPTLLLHGTDDLITVAENSRLLAERIPDVRLHLIVGARHGYFEEFADEAATVVLEFLAAHPLGDAADVPDSHSSR